MFARVVVSLPPGPGTSEATTVPSVPVHCVRITGLVSDGSARTLTQPLITVTRAPTGNRTVVAHKTPPVIAAASSQPNSQESRLIAVAPFARPVGAYGI